MDARVERLTDLGVEEAVAAIASREISAVGLLEACLERIAATDGALQAWVTVDADGARAAARERDGGMDHGLPPGPLHGVPIGIKDIIDVAGLPTLAGAPPFAHRFPSDDAMLVARLRAAGAVIVGKTRTTPFAFKDPALTQNPWSSGHTPGGSSSGPAAAVAARQVPGAIGTQTVGSILRPAAFCGVVGLKAGFGDVPLEGVMPLARSFDHAGPIARSVADVALIEGVLAEASSVIVTVERPRLSVSRELLDAADPELRAHLEGIIARFGDAGAIIDEVDLPGSLARVVAAGLVILEAEVAAAHAPMFAKHEAGYPPEIAGLVRAGLARQAAGLDQAERDRDAFRDAVVPVLGAGDALLSPVAPGPAPRRGEGTGDFSLCAPWSFIGTPAIAIPTGLDDAGLPLAIQLVGPPGRLDRLLGAAAWAERTIGFHERPPERP